MAQNDDVSVVPDPFSDDLFAPLDTRDEGGSLSEQLEKIAAEQNAPVVAPEPEVKPEPESQPTEAPKVYEYDDGATVTVEKGSRGWKATLDSNTGAPPEVFYGSTKDELLINLSAGKMKATQKIREMNKKMKLESDGPAPSAPQVEEVETGHVLTADDIFDIKTKLASNPDLAFETWFQKRTGMTVAQLANLARTGKAASDELSAEAIAKEFLGRHEEYDPTESNFKSIIAWLCKYKLSQPLAGRDPNSMIEVLYNAGKFNGESLDEAFEDLKSDGLLDLRQEEPVEVAPEPTPEPEVAPVKAVEQPKPTATNERIARQVSRPRAGQGNLGIRTKETTSSQTADSERPLSAEELDNLSDEQVSKLFADVRKLRLGTRRP